jgi:hypothetical protein
VDNEKCIGLQLHQATISVAVMDSTGRIIMECILETKAVTILEFFAGPRGSLSVTFEEGTCAAWLYDLLQPHVGKLLVCNPRKNALLKAGNKSDRIDTRRWPSCYVGNQLKPVYHGRVPQVTPGLRPGTARKVMEDLTPGSRTAQDLGHLALSLLVTKASVIRHRQKFFNGLNF